MGRDTDFTGFVCYKTGRAKLFIAYFRWNATTEGFKTTLAQPPRKDFSVFMQIKIIGASKGFETSDQETKQNCVQGET